MKERESVAITDAERHVTREDRGLGSDGVLIAAREKSPPKRQRRRRKPRARGDKSVVVRENCWYSLQQLVDWYQARMEWASREERPLDRYIKRKNSTRAFHYGLKILEHWDELYKYTVLPNGEFQPATITTLITDMDEEPQRRVFKVLYEFGQRVQADAAQNIIDSLDWAGNVSDDVRERKKRYEKDRKDKRTFDSQMSSSGLVFVKQEYLKIGKSKGRPDADWRNQFRMWLTREDWVFFSAGKID